MTAKGYLERKIKEIKMEIEMEERQFDELSARGNRDYGAIAQTALKVKSLQDELKGMQVALDTIVDFEN